jgi:hypothetical protein
MKFWELISAFREFEGDVAAVLSSPKWKQPFGEWNAQRSSLIQGQDREKLDSEVPDALVFEVASAVGDKLSLYLEDGWLRCRPLSAHAQRLSSLEIVIRYGGAVLEEALEHGLAQVKT